MTKLLLNNVEQTQPPNTGRTDIVLYARTSANPDERIEIIATGFSPYFYAPADEVEARRQTLLGLDCINEVASETEQSLAGEPVRRVGVPKPQDVRAARQLFDETWEADVHFTNRFRIDTGVRAYIEVPDEYLGDGPNEVPYDEIDYLEGGLGAVEGGGNVSETGLHEVEPRVVTLDIEVDDRGDGFPTGGEERILSIVAHDSYTGETAGFIDGDGRPIHEMFPDGAPDGVDSLDVRPNEQQMLIAFRSWFTSMDPDLITGWNVADFDMTYLIQRMGRVNEVNKDALSPLGWSGVTNRGEPRIKGRTIYDLLTVYKKNSRTELDSYRLDNVAQDELGAEKIEFSGSYYDLYENDPEKFIRYNALDVSLVVDINREAEVIAFRDRLRRQVGVDFEDSYDPKDFDEMMCRRKLKQMGVVGSTAPEWGDEPDDDFEGAFVFDPYEGVTNNVVGIDLASLYPYTMAMLNASPETKVDDAEGAAVAANGQAFDLTEDGLFRSIVLEALELKAEYKEVLQQDDLTSKEREKAARDYMAAKVVVNSIYGVSGWERFFLYDKDVAEAVTLTGQKVIQRTAEYVEKCGFSVIYGDTDSCYIKFPDDWSRDECLDAARSLSEDLNNEVYPDFAEEFGIPRQDNLWEIEVEAYMSRFFQAGKKKRYAYIAEWEDGHVLDKPKYSISGFSSKRSDSSELTEETEERILRAILDGDEDTVGTIVFESAKEIAPTNPEWERIGIPGGMNNRITDNPSQAERDGYYAVRCDGDNCYPQDAHPRGAYNSNAILNTDFGQGDKPMRVYITDTYFDQLDRADNVLCFETAADLGDHKNKLTVDVERMTETLLVKPLGRILSAVDTDIHAAIQGQEQTGLGAWE